MDIPASIVTQWAAWLDGLGIWALRSNKPSYTHTVPSTLCVAVQLLSHFQPFATPWTVAHQAALSMGFPRQAYGSGFLFPFLGDLPSTGAEPASPALAGAAFTAEPPGKSLRRDQSSKPGISPLLLRYDGIAVS